MFVHQSTYPWWQQQQKQHLVINESNCYVYLNENRQWQCFGAFFQHTNPGVFIAQPGTLNEPVVHEWEKHHSNNKKTQWTAQIFLLANEQRHGLILRSVRLIPFQIWHWIHAPSTKETQNECERVHTHDLCVCVQCPELRKHQMSNNVLSMGATVNRNSRVFITKILLPATLFRVAGWGMKKKLQLSMMMAEWINIHLERRRSGWNVSSLFLLEIETTMTSTEQAYNTTWTSS